MCVVSFVADHYQDKFKAPFNQGGNWIYTSPVTRQEFDALKKQVEEMVELLKKAKIYDEVNNQPDCEIEAKIEVLRKISELVGINLDDVIKSKQ